MIIRSLVAICLALIIIPDGRAEDIRLTVSRSDCDRITKYIAAQDVIYQEGKDVHGRAVAPADLEATTIRIPERIFIDLSLPFKDLLKNYNPKLKNAEVRVGAIEYDIASGRMFFNGQELADPALNAIALECRTRYP
ncbi:MAG: hypothetical protein CMN55_11495 [Sneathiella sp.]|jgi:hypothetical protein|uniref:hypothetical protein n=1 Tax=Sneathiella sp. TaxID=1964365 RepID=UPI000C5726DB|nr:hypothetical protein [Sneathiella sp.]MAL79716.1 hypothetical protein [Sneathiella sp.]|tara:strand:- start:19 stop:429 length:411 start_codon:yes stop_codon:yes gene_type:complete